MPRIRVLPYGPSNSARELAANLGGMRLRLTASLFRQRPDDTVINWGRSGTVEGVQPTLNPYAAVNTAANKLLSFRALQAGGVSIPEFTTSHTEATNWVNDGFKVVERHALRGHSGEGIEIVDNVESLNHQVPLFVKYIPKQSEYRVHIVNNTIIDVQQKRRSRDVETENVNWQVRNLAGGFIFARENLDVPSMVLEEALKAVDAIGLDFGAVDLIYNNNRSTAYVLEVNTACGLQGTTLERYTEAFRAVIEGRPIPENSPAVQTNEPAPAPTPEPIPVLFAGTPYEGQTTEELTGRLDSILTEAEAISELLGV